MTPKQNKVLAALLTAPNKAAAAQAAEDAAKFGDGLPAVFHRANRQGWRVTMALSDWVTLYQAAESGNNQKFLKEGIL